MKLRWKLLLMALAIVAVIAVAVLDPVPSRPWTPLEGELFIAAVGLGAGLGVINSKLNHIEGKLDALLKGK